MKRKPMALLLSLALCLLPGCGMGTKAVDLTEGYTPKMPAASAPLTADETKIFPDFAVRLLQACREKGKNTLLSPPSVLCALAMTANGARGETLSQAEAVLGAPIEELNRVLAAVREKWVSDREKCRLTTANSVWLKDTDEFTPNPDFLQVNADIYEAGVFKAPFNDRTLREINEWVKENTDGMIPEMLKSLSDSAVLYLINAVAFDAEWRDVYTVNQVSDGTFTREDGTVQTVPMMASEEYKYLEDENTTGFLKPYEGGDYAFAALLPAEGLSVDDYVACLTGEKLSDLLAGAKSATVFASLPKFESETELELSGALKEMGMKDAFDFGKADFSGMGTSAADPLAITDVVHKTYISVGEKGTRAGAATLVTIVCGAAPVQEPKTVKLDRPFVYAVVDCATLTPIFLGITTEI